MSYLTKAIKLAKKGYGRVSPNPLVGCVIVKNNKTVAEGYHAKYGVEHAEIVALKKAGSKAKGATMYVNLEPCCHQGKTPPCTQAIIKAGIKKIVIGIADPNPLVWGKGISQLQEAAIEVFIEHEHEAKILNEAYIKFITKKKPFVILKSATTLDGKIATSGGQSKYITNEEARKYSHELRNIYDAILVSSNTILSDDPRLTCRIENGRDPKRVIVDSSLRSPLSSKVFEDNNFILATTDRANKDHINFLRNKGGTVLVLKKINNKVDLNDLMQKLYENNIISVLIEGGETITSIILKEKLADKILFFIAPKIFGSGKSAIGDINVKNLNDALTLKNVNFKKLKNNILVEGYL